MKIRQFISKFSCTIVDFSATLLHLKTTNLNFFCFLFGVIFLKCAFLFIYLQKWPTYNHLKKKLLAWLFHLLVWLLLLVVDLVLLNCRRKSFFYQQICLWCNQLIPFQQAISHGNSPKNKEITLLFLFLNRYTSYVAQISLGHF